jgi:hypothetical protein
MMKWGIAARQQLDGRWEGNFVPFSLSISFQSLTLLLDMYSTFKADAFSSPTNLSMLLYLQPKRSEFKSAHDERFKGEEEPVRQRMRWQRTTPKAPPACQGCLRGP